MDDYIPYWLDKSHHQPFAEIGREDLLFGVLKGGSESVSVSAPHLKGEYNNDGVEVVSFTSNDAEVSASDGQASAGISSFLQSPSLKANVVPLSNSDTASLPQEFQTSALSDADREGVFLALREGFVLLTNDGSLIYRLQYYADTYNVVLPPVFRPTHILAANILKGTITIQEADEIWRTWRNLDERWVPKEPLTFNDFYLTVDRELLFEYFAIE